MKLTYPQPSWSMRSVFLLAVKLTTLRKKAMIPFINRTKKSDIVNRVRTNSRTISIPPVMYEYNIVCAKANGDIRNRRSSGCSLSFPTCKRFVTIVLMAREKCAQHGQEKSHGRIIVTSKRRKGNASNNLHTQSALSVKMRYAGCQFTGRSDI